MKSDMEKEAGTFILRSYGEFFKQQYQDYTSILDTGIKEENKTFAPVQVVMKTNELTTSLDLVASDNTVMTKILSVLTSLCVEVNELKTEAFERLYIFLSL